MRRKTPQEKKRLSYERDRRNCYGEAPHAARKWIPLRKAMRNRANRHYQNQQLNSLCPTPEQDFADELESLMNHKAPKEWEKHRDWPLGEIISEKLKNREIMRTHGGRNALHQIRYDKQED